MSADIHTTCPYCGVGCGILARPDEVDGTVSVQGDAQHSANSGRLCLEGTALAETVDLDGRLLYPEVAGARVDWHNALDTVASGFRRIIDEHGPDPSRSTCPASC